MLKIRKHISPFFLLWFTVVSISICIAVFLSSPLGEFIYKHNGKADSASNDGTVEFFLSFLFLVGLFMGFGQWVVINTKIKKTYGWILATLIGFSIGTFVSLWFFSLILRFSDKYYKIYDVIHLVGTLAGAGMFTGFCQWIYLKRKIADSLKWSLVNGLSFSMGFLPTSVVSGYPVDHPVAWAISIIVSVALGTLISGCFVESLIIRPHTQQQDVAI